MCPSIGNEMSNISTLVVRMAQYKDDSDASSNCARRTEGHWGRSKRGHGKRRNSSQKATQYFTKGKAIVLIMGTERHCNRHNSGGHLGATLPIPPNTALVMP